MRNTMKEKAFLSLSCVQIIIQVLKSFIQGGHIFRIAVQCLVKRGKRITASRIIVKQAYSFVVFSQQRQRLAYT